MHGADSGRVVTVAQPQRLGLAEVVAHQLVWPWHEGFARVELFLCNTQLECKHVVDEAGHCVKHVKRRHRTDVQCPKPAIFLLDAVGRRLAHIKDMSEVCAHPELFVGLVVQVPPQFYGNLPDAIED